MPEQPSEETRKARPELYVLLGIVFLEIAAMFVWQSLQELERDRRRRLPDSGLVDALQVECRDLRRSCELLQKDVANRGERIVELEQQLADTRAELRRRSAIEPEEEPSFRIPNPPLPEHDAEP